jgi:hypothetical protein
VRRTQRPRHAADRKLEDSTWAKIFFIAWVALSAAALVLILVNVEELP